MESTLFGVGCLVLVVLLFIKTSLLVFFTNNIKTLFKSPLLVFFTNNFLRGYSLQVKNTCKGGNNIKAQFKSPLLVFLTNNFLRGYCLQVKNTCKGGKGRISRLLPLRFTQSRNDGSGVVSQFKTSLRGGGTTTKQSALTIPPSLRGGGTTTKQSALTLPPSLRGGGTTTKQSALQTLISRLLPLRFTQCRNDGSRVVSPFKTSLLVFPEQRDQNFTNNFLRGYYLQVKNTCKGGKGGNSIAAPSLRGGGTTTKQSALRTLISRLLPLSFTQCRNDGSGVIRLLLHYLFLNPVRTWILTTCYLFLATPSFSQHANIEFVENKGQWNDLVKYKGTISNGAFFLEEKGFKVLQHNAAEMDEINDLFHSPHATPSLPRQGDKSAIQPANPENYILHSHAYNVTFANAGKPTIVPDKALPSYNNYMIGSNAAKWKGNCKIFQAVTYANMYKDIDVRYYTDADRLKYDIIVKPGADPNSVAMKYEGTEGLRVKDGQLIIKTSVGETKELAPFAYQVINGIKKEVKCNFRVAGNIVYFDIENYSKADVLIIDPTLVFCSFTGSPADNWGYTATYGPDGSFYAGGIVFSNGFPVSNGAFQSTFNGGIRDEENLSGYDIGIMKFNSSGSNRIYATYIGGSGNEQPQSMVVSYQGELVVAGRSNSGNYPLKNAGKIGTNGDYDIVLTKLTLDGTDIIGSCKIGGSAYDGVNIRPKYASPKGVGSIRRNYGDDARSEVIIDNSGNILLASNTQSAIFPTTAGAFQTTFGGIQDGVFIKMDATLSNLLYSSYIGGSDNDAAFVLAINPSNSNVYIGGNTASSNLPGDKSGVKYPLFQGNTDGFVSIISPAGALLKTTYIGTSGFDMLYGIQFDRFSFPYIMGTTTATWPVTSNVAFSQTGGKQFIAKLIPDLSDYLYSTVFGTGGSLPNISPIAFLVDRCENVYVSGWGGQANNIVGYPNEGTAGLTVTSNAIQTTSDNSDFYFFVLEKNARSQLYGSFFGQTGGYGEHVDGGTSRYDKNGVIYQAICANCGRDVTFPTTPGAWSRTNGSVECNLAALKISFNLAGVAGSVRAAINGVLSDTVGCVPVTVQLTDTLAEGQSYIWNFGDGSANITTLVPTISHTYNAVGNYRVMLVSVDSLKCNLADTAYLTIRVKSDKANLGFTSKKLAPCTAFNYLFANKTYVTPQGKTFTNQSFIWDFGDKSPPVKAGLDTIYHSFPSAGVYIVKLTLVDTNFCNAPEVIVDTMRIAVNVKAMFITPIKGCAPYNAYFNNTSEAGEQFFWTFGDGSSSTVQYPTHYYPTPGTFTIKLVVIDSGTCNKSDSFSYTITVSDKPRADFTFLPVPPQPNTPVQFFNTSIDAVKYEWLFGDGESISTTNTDPVKHIYNETRPFEAMLVAINTSGCADTARKIINAKVFPLLDVPSAFTPNGDGINDRVMVRGFGIIKMSWQIFNRWGNIVFETSDRTQPWDGKYKGALQPAEVYHYILDVEYGDNTRLQKKGDITLLR